MPSIYDYTNYRRYLRDVFNDLKNAPSGFSYARFCKALGLRSTNYLKLIIEGKRNLTPSNVLRLGKFLELTFEETRYLETLTYLCRSKTSLERSHYSNCLKSLKREGAVKYGRKAPKELLEKWYYPAVLVALHQCPLDESTERMLQLIGISAEEGRAAAQTLLEMGALILNEQHYQMVDANVLMVDSKKSKLKYKNFLKDQLKLSSKKLEEEYDHGAQFFSQTLSISKQSWPTYLRSVRSLMSETARQSDSDSAEQLIQLNVQLFPLGREFKG